MSLFSIEVSNGLSERFINPWLKSLLHGVNKFLKKQLQTSLWILGVSFLVVVMLWFWALACESERIQRIIEIYPQAQFLDIISSPMPTIVLITGLIISVLLVVVIYMLLYASSVNSFINKIVLKLDRAIDDKQHFEKEFLNLAVTVEDQVQERTRYLKHQKSSALSLMQQVLKSQKDKEHNEKLVRKQYDSLKSSLESAGIGVWTWKADEDLVVLDDYAHKILGLNPGSFHGSCENFLNLIHAGDRRRVNKEFNSALNMGIALSSGFKAVDSYGNERDVLMRGKAFYNIEGIVSYMAGVCMDITEQKRSIAMIEDHRALRRHKKTRFISKKPTIDSL